MDTATEKIVLDKLVEWSKEKTLIAITRRNNLKSSYKSIIIDKGVVWQMM